MGELYEPFPRLPKNIRQIGERDQILRLYVEDYVNTYLKRLQPARGADLRVGLLLGSRETHDDIPYVFVDGALEMETTAREGEQVAFTEDAWKKAYQEVEQLFPKRTVQGWFLCGGPGCSLSPLDYWRQHNQYFTGKNQLMYLSCGLDGEEAVYITSSDGFYKLRGYSIYYERNQMMQDYMVLRRDAPRAESGVDDRAIQNFRQKMDEHRQEAGRHRNTMGILTGLCGALAVTVLAGGVTMFNNYQKMHRMESVIASAMPEGRIREGLLAAGGSGRGEAYDAEITGGTQPEYVVEEAAGNVYPTEARSGESTEQSSEIKRETMPQNGWRAGEESIPERTGAGEQGAEQQAAGEPYAGQETAGAGEQETEQQTAGAGEQGAEQQNAESSSAETVSSSGYRLYTVGEGESLYGICYKLYQSLKYADEISRVNALPDRDSIYAGQKLLVP